MNTRLPRLYAIAAILGLVAVATGAFAAHGLKNVFSEYQQLIWQKAVFYQFVHVLAVFSTTQLANVKLTSIAVICFISGIVFFSGSLYLLAVTGVGKFGMITPIGGCLFIVGWAVVSYAWFNQANRPKA